MCNAYNHDAFCNCGWGGEGHIGAYGNGFHGSRFLRDSGTDANAQGVYSQLERSKSAVYEGDIADVCKPTVCKTCGAEIYFVRNNGGSVWLDELGWPWPKHPCFYDSLDCIERNPTSFRNVPVGQSTEGGRRAKPKINAANDQLYAMLRMLRSHSANSTLGIISAVSTDSTGKGLDIDIVLMNHARAPITVQTGFDGYNMRLTDLTGQLVYFAFDEKTVYVISRGWEFAFKFRTGTLPVNQTYFHPTFGSGILTNEEESYRDVVLTFEFSEFGRKKIALGLVPLTLLSLVPIRNLRLLVSASIPRARRVVSRRKQPVAD